LTLSHLARETETKWGYLRSIVQRQIDDYTAIRRLKRDGTYRAIWAPMPSLMHVQRWILSNVLSGLKFHDAAYAYRRGRCIRDCAEQHIGARWLLKMDLHNFFGTIEEARVYGALRGMGYPALLAFEMARICTKPLWLDADKRWLEGRGVDAYGSPLRGVLPQGAPTSGALANAVAFSMDAMLRRLADSNGLSYTRYSDDLTFSSSGPFERASIVKLVTEVERAISLAGFVVHRKKTRVVPPGARKIVLGLMLTEREVRLVPEFRSRLDNHIRCVDKYGPAGHAAARRFDSALSMINYVDGCLAFALDIEPEWTADRNQRWLDALYRHGHPVNRDG
ncbi:reverse transcriptase family protein, partial [Microbacterium testaceum]